MANDWVDFKLSEVINLIGGGTPKRSIAEYWGGDIPWLSVKDFNNEPQFGIRAQKKDKKRSPKLLK